MVFRRLGVLALGLLLLAAGTAAAQETRGSIEGVVKDTTGGVLPGVTVTVKHEATGAVTTAVTDTTGAYRIPGLQTGMYTVTATLSGFKPETMDKIDVGVGQQSARAADHVGRGPRGRGSRSAPRRRSSTSSRTR